MDEEKIKAKFTVWIETVAYRTKLNYIRSEKKHFIVDSIEEISEGRLLLSEESCSLPISDRSRFDFKIDWLESAFTNLSELGRKILELHLVEGITLKEISNITGYSYRHVKRIYSFSLEAIKMWRENH
ncbi:MAG: sigma-70 family RNA polymerase sigma factor [Clostridia bacterium]|nr:sigma-70 family RNA polymerase sigma factor [Clostridia bacterium]